ncbi:TPA: ROK family protein [Raoultella planticola]|nr:ROK family protein [Raoultella planticola]
MNYLGLDVGGTKIAAVVMDERGQEVGRFRCATRQESRQAFVSAIVDFIATIRAETGGSMAIGIALPGSVSPRHGAIRNANIQVINGYRLHDALEQQLGQPVVLANDGNCFALSEACDGAGADVALVFGMTLGTGCGGGIALERQPFVGASGIAAECGHITLPGYSPAGDGPPVRCYCGRLNCVESFISGTGLSERYRLLTGDSLSSEQIIARAQAGEPAACQQVYRFRQQLARTLATIINILDPGVIVLGGGLSNATLLVADLQAEVAPHVFIDHFITPIISARHGDSSGMRGAAWLAARSGVRS